MDTLRAKLSFSAIFLGAASGVAAASSGVAGIQPSSYSTHSHLLIPGEIASKYALTPLQVGERVVGLRIELMGEAAAGEMEAAGKSLEKFSDERTQRITVAGNAIEIRFSPAAAAGGVDYFDYRSRADGSVSLDYWAKGRSGAAGPAEPATMGKAARAGKPKQGRKVAMRAAKAPLEAKGQAECSRKLDLLRDGYARWKIYHRLFPYAQYFNLDTADAEYDYPFAAGKGSEEKFSEREWAHYRLALKLAKESKFGLALRAIAFFEESFPKSDLKKELEFLKGAVLVRLAKILNSEKYFGDAQELYRRIYFEDAASERGRRALAYLVQIQMDAGRYMQALEYSLIGAEPANAERAMGKESGGKQPSRTDVTPWVYRLAAAETLFLVGEYDRAERSYQLISDANNAVSPEAVFRIGEVYAARNFWERAILSFEKAQARYPKLASKYPTAAFNLAEAYFRIGKLDSSKRFFKQFLASFQGDRAAWAAELRLAEIEQMQMRDGDAKAAFEAREGYERVINRYPYSAGEMFAQLRLLGCAREFRPGDPRKDYYHSLFKKRDLKPFADELVDSVETERWFDLAQAQFGVWNKDYGLALENSDRYRGRFSSTPLGGAFQKLFEEGALRSVLDFSKGRRFKDAIEFARKYGDLVAEPHPADYMVALAEANLSEGRLDVAAQMVDAMEGRLAEMGPETRDSFHALASKKEWLLSRDMGKTLKLLGQISDSGALAAYKFQKMAQIHAEAGQWSDVLRDAAQVLDSPFKAKFSIGEKMELECLRIEALSRLNSFGAVVKSADDFEFRYGAYTENAKALARVRDLRALALYESKDYAAAATAFSDALKRDAQGPRRAEFEFKRARSLASIGREDEAKDGFRKLAQGQGDLGVWRKSAQTELDQLQWENDIKNQMGQRRGALR